MTKKRKWKRTRWVGEHTKDGIVVYDNLQGNEFKPIKVKYEKGWKYIWK